MIIISGGGLSAKESNVSLGSSSYSNKESKSCIYYNRFRLNGTTFFKFILLYADMLIGIFTGHLKSYLVDFEIWKLIELLPFGVTWSYAFEGMLGTVSALIGLY